MRTDCYLKVYLNISHILWDKIVINHISHSMICERRVVYDDKNKSIHYTIQIIAKTKRLTYIWTNSFAKIASLALSLDTKWFFRMFGNKTFHKSRATAHHLAIVWLEEFALIALQTFVVGRKYLPREHMGKEQKSMTILIIRNNHSYNIIIYSLYGKERKYIHGERRQLLGTAQRALV